MRDQKLSECADSPVLEEKKHKLTGITVTPAPQSIYFRQIELLSGDTADAVTHSDVCRPYFVIQNEKGVLFSSMINGVRNVDLHGGPHVFRVWKQLKDCRDLVFKMYHLPFGRQGELIFECRLHVSMLLDRTQDGAFESIRDGETREVALSVENGDFDCIASWYTLPKQFAVKIHFARDASAFGSELPPLTTQDGDESYDTGDAASSLIAQSQPRSFHGPSSTSGQPCDPKPIRYDGPAVVTFLVDQPNIRTAFGDCRLDKIDVLRRVQRNRLDIFLLFHVEIAGGVTKVLPYRHLFRYILPGPIRERMILMGATEDSLNETSPAAFFEGPGKLHPARATSHWRMRAHLFWLLQECHSMKNTLDGSSISTTLTLVRPSVLLSDLFVRALTPNAAAVCYRFSLSDNRSNTVDDVCAREAMGTSAFGLMCLTCSVPSQWATGIPLADLQPSDDYRAGELP